MRVAADTLPNAGGVGNSPLFAWKLLLAFWLIIEVFSSAPDTLATPRTTSHCQHVIGR